MNRQPSTVNRRPPTLPIMAHLVLGYPSMKESLRTAAQYVAAGVEVLELQIPFSHPTADGSVITIACQEAVANGATIRDCLSAIAVLRQQFPEQEIMVMSYLNRVYAFGFQEFVAEIESMNIRYLIIPDLPVDASPAFIPEFSTVNLVPVLAANTTERRLDEMLSMGFDFFYLMSDFKITGSGFSLHPQLRKIMEKIKSHSSGNSKTRVGIGFGISTPEQAKFIAEQANLAIIGSALIQAQQTGKLEEYLESLQYAFSQ